MTPARRGWLLRAFSVLVILLIGLITFRPVAGQAPVPPLLLVVDAASPNPFGRYLGEVLKAEGLNAFEIVELANLTSARLAAARVTILAEMPLSPTAATMFANHVAGGGRLVAMRPDPQIADLFGGTAAAPAANGYLAINQAVATGAGLASLTLPLQGTVTPYSPLPGSTTVATYWSDRVTVTPYAAVVRNSAGTAVAWGYDLARSVAYARQGNPAFAGVERDGQAPVTTMEPFAGHIDLQRIRVPHADIQMRLFSRVVTDLAADAVPLPRLWYFPEGKRALLVASGDSHVSNQSAYTQLRTKVESLGGRMTFYLARYVTYPDAATAASWRANGHELSLHPYGTTDGESFQQSFISGRNWFTGAGLGTPGLTTRTHRLEWVGWTDGAAVAAANGMRLETSAYSWGPALGPFTGTQAKGYITGSGLPMRFVTTTGALLPIHQQATQLIDHQLFVADGYNEDPLTFTTAEGLTYSRGMLQDAVDQYHTALVTQFHLDYYLYEKVKGWVDGTLDFAASLGMPIWPAQRWLQYLEARDGATFSAVQWNASAGQLTFTLQSPANAPALSTMLPSSVNGVQLASVVVDGTLVPVTTQNINGRSFAFFAVGTEGAIATNAVSHSVVATYDGSASDNTPPAISNVTAAPTAAGTATITWTTNEPSTSQVQYGIGSPSLATGVNAALTLSHSVTLTGLTANATYQYRVLSSDAAGNSGTSATVSFTTPPPAPLPSIAIAGVTVTEGPGATAVMSVTLSAASALPVSAVYSTINGTAVSGSDFAATGGTVSFAAGETVRTIQVPLINDSVQEPTEGFTVTLSAPQNATLGAASANVIIVDDDAAGPVTVTVPIAAGADDANEDGATFTSDATTVWIGAAATPATSHTGLRFAGVPVPRNAVVTSARLRMTAAATGWVSMDFAYRIEDAGNAAAFSAASRPSQRTMAAPSVIHFSNVQWVAGTSYVVDDLAPLVQHVVSRGDWNAGNALAIVTTGTGGAWARKFAQAFEAGVASAPALEISYQLPNGSTPSLSVADTTVTEGTGTGGTAAFAVSLSAASTQTVTVNYATAAGSALAGTDFTSTSGQLTFAPGVTVQVVNVPIVGDSLSEAAENFSLTLSGAVNATLGDGTGVATITDDDVTLPAVSIGNVTVAENVSSGFAVFVATLSAPSSNTVTANYATAAGSASAGSDFIAASGQVTFAPGVTSQTISVALLDDALVEGNEAFTVTLSAPVNATLGTATGTATITDNDAPPLPALSINDVTVTEGTGAPVSATFTVQLSAASTGTVTVNYATVAGSAAPPADFTAASGTLTFTPGTVTQPVVITVAGDAVAEASEGFSVVLSSAVGATISDGTGVATIIDDDAGSGPVTTSFAILSGADDVNEDAGVFTASANTLWLGAASTPASDYTGLRFAGVTVPRNAIVTAARLRFTAAQSAWLPMNFEYGIQDIGTAPAFSDASRPSQRTLAAPRVTHSSNAQWVAGTAYTLDDIAPLVQAVVSRGDWNAGNALALVLRATGGAWARKFAQAFEAGSATAPVLEVTYQVPGGGTPTLNVADTTVTEGTGAGGTAVFTVTLSSASAQTVTVNYTTVNGTAVAGSDFTAASGQLTFAPGVTSQTITVAIAGDSVSEPAETFSVVLSGAVNATAGAGVGIATVVDDDLFLPTISVSNLSVAENVAGGTASFTVTLSAPSTTTVTANYATGAGTAVAGSDFVAASGQVTFAPGETTRTIAVTILDDGASEPAETFSLALSGLVNAVAGTVSATATITDNDGVPSGPITATFQVAAAGDDVNEDGAAFDAGTASMWLGNASSATVSYAGVRFAGVTIPPNAVITSARLEVNAAATQWIGMSFEFAVEAAGNAAPFSTTARPSQRTLLTPRVAHQSNAQWVAGTWYTLEQLAPVVQALVERGDWASGNALALIMRGTGGAWGRKAAQSFDGAPAAAPRLVVTYTLP